MTRRLGIRMACAAAAGGLALVPMAFAAGADSNPTSALGGWNVSADGNGVDILIDNATGLSGIHPLSEADFPEAQSTFQTGPFGSGLATVFWPGSAAGDFGSLSPELGIPSQLQPFFSMLNDPVRASSQYPSGPASATYPAGAPAGGIEMHSEANATGTTAVAALTDESVPSLVSFSSAKGASSATASSQAKGVANSNIGKISLIGGLIDIGSVTSTAQTSSDGNTATGSATTHVTGVTVLGQPASIGSDGLVLPNMASTLGPLTGPIVQNALSETINALGLQVTQLPSIDTHNGASDSVTSGGLQVTLTPPSSAAPLLEQLAAVIAPLFPAQAAIIPTLPGLLQGASVTMTFGRATASAAASPAFNFSFNPPPVPTPNIPSTPAALPVSTGSVAVSPASSPSTATSPAVAATPAQITPVTQASPPPPVALATTPINLSRPLTAGLVILGLLVAGALGAGLWRMAGLMASPEDAGTVCPLGQENP